MKNKTIFILFGVLIALVISSFFFTEGFETGITGYLNKATSASANGSGSGNGSTSANDNQSTYYDPYTKQTNAITTGTVYTGPNGKTVTLTKNVDGSQTITLSDGSTKFTPSSANIFIGPNGNKATIITTSDGKEAIKVDIGADSKIYTINNMPESAQYYGNTTTNVPTEDSSSTNIDVSGGTVSGPNGNSVSYATGTIDYSSSLPPGIPGSQIPPGQQDLYILKSQVVPPVCPVCPANCPNTNGSSKKCPACKPCGRCPEPSMTCKAVPNYGAIGAGANSLDAAASYIPVLSDFSNFGM
jgi:hypothetical protein